MEQVTQNTIDIEKVLKSKMGHKARFVPKPLTNWLKHIIHQDEVNKYLWESRHLSGTDWLEECVRYLDMTLELVGEENLPDKNDGKLYTFVSNHPLGGEDGVALGAIIGRHYDGISIALIARFVVSTSVVLCILVWFSALSFISISVSSSRLLASRFFLNCSFSGTGIS